MAEPSKQRRQSLDPLERLDTPNWCTRVLLDRMRTLRGQHIIEPCAGAGRMVDVLRNEGGCIVSAYDIAPRRDGIAAQDATARAFWRPIPAQSALVTNPAFSMSADLFRAAWHADRPIALFLRLSWLEAANERADIPDPAALIIVPRPKFIQSPEFEAIRIAAAEAKGKKLEPWGGDNVTCAWAIWNHRDPELSVRPIQRVTRKDKARLSWLETASAAAVA